MGTKATSSLVIIAAIGVMLYGLKTSFWVFVIGAFAMIIAMAFRTRASQPTEPAVFEPPQPRHHWTHDGNFEFDVVGESFYQQSIRTLAQRHAAADQVTAILWPQGNEHDQLAVGVYIDGLKVGHLSREDARSFRRRLGAKKLGTAVTSCPAMFTGGHEIEPGKYAMTGVQLDMKPFD